MARRGRPNAWKSVAAGLDEPFTLKRNALLREAGRAFGIAGYHRTSLDDVARTLGVTKAALYHYVRNKQEILFECHMLSLDLGEQALRDVRASGRSGLEKVVQLARQYIEQMTGEFGTCAMLTELDALEPDNRATVMRRRDAFDASVRELLREGIADGSIRAVDPKLSVFFFMGAVNWITRWFRPEGALSGAEIARDFADLIEGAIRAR